MVIIPYSLIDNNQLTIYERAILPLVIRHTLSWGKKEVGVEAYLLSQILQLDVKDTIEILDSLVTKGILEIVHVKEKGVRTLLYSISKAVLENSATPVAEAPSVQSKDLTHSSYFLNMSDEKYNDLKTYSMKLISSLGLNEDVFVDFELYQRGKNSKSYDWPAEFQRWALREQKKKPSTNVTKHDMSFKPTPEQFQVTQHFISYLQKIDPQFVEPTDWSWAQEIKTLVEIEGYSVEEIKKVVDWLFSSKGDWYRPNIQDAFSLRKKFSYLISHVRSYRDARTKLPPGVSIFDLYEGKF